MSPFVQTGILPFLYCNFFCFTSTETFLEIGKIQLHQFNLQKSLSVCKAIYIFHHWMVHQGSSSFHSYQHKYMKFVPHSIVASLNNLLIFGFFVFLWFVNICMFHYNFQAENYLKQYCFKEDIRLGQSKGQRDALSLPSQFYRC